MPFFSACALGPRPFAYRTNPMSSKYILALDQGTTSSRAILFDHAGRVVCKRAQEFPQIYPHPGWVEHNAEDIWSSQANVAVQVLQDQGITLDDVAAVGIANQRETTVVWDRATGVPLANAIVWQDRRTSGDCDALAKAGWGPKVRAKTGLVLDAYFSGTKLKWLLDHVPGARKRAENGDLLFGTIVPWLGTIKIDLMGKRRSLCLFLILGVFSHATIALATDTTLC